MKILKNYDLAKLNTFNVRAQAKFFVELLLEEDIRNLFLSSEFKSNPRLFLGGGSNILFTQDFDGMVILNRLKGIEILGEDKKSVFIKSMGGEKWHDLVVFCVDKGYWGIENLSLIPGTVGASPVQNIGAYGAELKDILENVETYEIVTGNKKIFKKEECNFGYSSIIFKNEKKGEFFISAIVVKLSKIENKNLDYKALQEYLKKNKVKTNTSKEISDVISTIRKSKLPDPALMGNAGSFFKNVFVTKNKLEELQRQYGDIPSFEEGNNIKIPAGWLIEKAGWKGKRIGNVGVHDKQALVLVNYGGATGEELKNLAEEIIASVFSKFGLNLEKEVNLI